jgi:hypothetical protein
MIGGDNIRMTGSALIGCTGIGNAGMAALAVKLSVFSGKWEECVRSAGTSG